MRKAKTTGKDLLSLLTDSGHRVTKVRKALLEILASLSTPLTVPQLLEALKQQSLPVNKTTVYRELEFLMAQKVVLEVDLLDGAKRYEIKEAGSHHHHLVCTSCRAIQCVEMHQDLDSLEQKICKKHKFKITSHVLEFFGICESCMA